MFSNLPNILLVVAGFGFLIFVHEFGHFIFAKLHGVKVIKFSLGFGPALIHFRIGETEYAISAIPLGGFCKLAGEVAGEMDEDSKNVPRERLLNSKTVGQRAQIFVAGALMNILVAFPLGIMMVAVGGPAPVPAVSVGAGTGFVAGMKDGDLVTEIAGKPVEFWFEMEREIDKQPVDQPFTITVRRNDTLIPIEITKTAPNDSLGLAPRTSTRIGFLHPAMPAQKAGFKLGDEIFSVLKGDEKIAINEFSEFERIVSESFGERLIVSVRRENPNIDGGYDIIPIEVVPEKETSYTIGATFDLLPVVSAVQNDSPAARAGIRADDTIVSIDGEKIERWGDVTSGISRAGLMIDIVVLRGGEQVTLIVERAHTSQIIGVAAKGESVMVADVLENSSAAQAGLQPQDRVLNIQGLMPGHVLGSLQRPRLPEKKPYDFGIEREGERMTLAIEPEPLYVGRIGVGSMHESRYYRPSLLSAIPTGIGNVIMFVGKTFEMLGGLFAGQVSTRELAGPVGVVTLTYRQAQSGWQHFIGVLMLISVSLGIFNLLPIPILDGGHLAFLVIEKIKGKPLNDKAMIAAQYVGLVLLLTLVLCVTWNDIRNFF